MYLEGADLVTSPTDLTKFLACTELTALDLAVARGRLRRPDGGPDAPVDETLELLFRKGLEHEYRYLEQLRQGSDVTEIDPSPLEVAAASTEQAIRAGASVIYQATFLHAGHRGHADFLLRTDRPSELGDWSYDVADTKLARRLKVPALLQMAEYGEHLLRLQGTPPEWLTVVAGDGVEHAYRYLDVQSYYRRLAGRFGRFVADPPATRAEPVQHCPQCRWQARCAAAWRAADHLSLVAFMRNDHREQLEAAGISTLSQLATHDPADLPRAIGRTSRERLVQQAGLQLAERRDGQPSYQLLEPVAGLGLLRLPEPDPGDLYLDFEGDPFAEPAGREYLAGLGDRSGGFTGLWAHSFEAEARLTEQLVDRILQQWQAHPQSHVYHYAPYERSALQRLTARHGVREAELDVLLRAEVLVDLYAVVRQGLRISKESYSLKKLEAFYWGHVRAAGGDTSDGTGAVADAMSSVVAYEQWLTRPDGDRDQQVLDQILAYNADDVRSTAALHDWLEDRRTELQAGLGSELARPASGATPTAVAPNDAEVADAQLADRLLGAGHPLLAGLVGWHRREQRPAWWELFRLADLDDEELVDDASPIGGPSNPVHVRDISQSKVWRYDFAPQDTRVRAGGNAVDISTQKSVGEVIAVDPEQGWVELKIGRRREPPVVRGFGPPGPVNDSPLRASIAATAARVLAGEDCLGARLLHREVPAGLPVTGAEPAGSAVVRIGTSLAGTVLAVQGPPGTGKSTAGAALIRALLDAGLKVGVTALSHQVVGNLLAKVGRPALQKTGGEPAPGGLIETADSNAAVAAALRNGDHQLAGGTAWLWASADLAGAVDVIVIDEAGQCALANAVAVAGAATAMVLLGDPQQLSQPSQAQHPHGAGVSALEHLLDGHDTVPPDRGIFLDTTWRMHPAITDFVSATSYEGRLAPAPGLERQRLVGTSPLGPSGSGLRFVPVSHQGNASASGEEASVVAGLVRDLLGLEWIDGTGVRRPLTPDQILVVAAYNAQVARLRSALADAGDAATLVPVGTVDKFQGREAAVVIYSLASSSAVDAPRGVDFLYDVHRLNVAVSRARAISVIVASPALLDAEVHNPQQLRLVNALCRFYDLSEPVGPP
ncbi:TM0106 family RecB-like putative nuclease [soil metagenome]